MHIKFILIIHHFITTLFYSFIFVCVFVFVLVFVFVFVFGTTICHFYICHFYIFLVYIYYLYYICIWTWHNRKWGIWRFIYSCPSDMRRFPFGIFQILPTNFLEHFSILENNFLEHFSFFKNNFLEHFSILENNFL